MSNELYIYKNNTQERRQVPVILLDLNFLISNHAANMNKDFYCYSDGVRFCTDVGTIWVIFFLVDIVDLFFILIKATNTK